MNAVDGQVALVTTRAAAFGHWGNDSPRLATQRLCAGGARAGDYFDTSWLSRYEETQTDDSVTPPMHGGVRRPPRPSGEAAGVGSSRKSPLRHDFLTTRQSFDNALAPSGCTCAAPRGWCW